MGRGGIVELPLPRSSSTNKYNGPGRSWFSLVSSGCKRRFGALCGGWNQLAATIPPRNGTSCNKK